MEYGTIFAAAHSTAIMPSLPDLHLPDVDSVRSYTVLYCALCFAVLGLASLGWGWVCAIYRYAALGWLVWVGDWQFERESVGLAMHVCL